MTNRFKQRIEELEMKTKPKCHITYYRVPGETLEDAKTRFLDCHGRDMTDVDLVVCYRRIDTNEIREMHKQ